MHVPSDYYPIYRWLLLLSLLVLMILFSCSGCCFCCLLVVVAVTVVFITLSCFARYVQSQHLGWAGKHQQHQQIPSHWCESLHCQEMAASRGYALLIPSRVGEARPVSSSQGWEMGENFDWLMALRWHTVFLTGGSCKNSTNGAGGASVTLHVYSVSGSQTVCKAVWTGTVWTVGMESHPDVATCE